MPSCSPGAIFSRPSLLRARSSAEPNREEDETPGIHDPKVASACQALESHHGEIAPLHLRHLFADDPDRARRLSAEGVGLFL